MTDILDAPLDGFAYEPGANAQLGRNYMAFCAIHYTAGACGGDRAVGLRGYFNVYIPRGDDCGPGATCFAGVGRICYHACEWNVWGPGIEFEKADDSVALTQYQLVMGRKAIQQLIALGIAPTYTDTPGNRVPVGGPISGFVSHRSLHEAACDEHYDYLTAEEMAFMLAPVPAPTPVPPPDWFTLQQEEDMAQLKALLVVHQPSGAVLLTGEDSTGRYCSWVRDPHEIKPLVDGGSIQDASSDPAQQVSDGFFNTFPVRGDDPRKK